ncbi:hypothetical protein NLU13_9243 [Sarocladium strictum]|uniref:Uncharacterized protein n=1 Tax=Sarocladium strictum TaxID=5046 RepID=A0AA39L465_SARSR|nr:hypothetical protein NLU13_9243 [Sarocladium strictum]
MAPISINTNVPPQNDPPSPTRPPVSPITPPLAPTTLPPGDKRPALTHTQQTEQVGIPPPAPLPIDFENNPDVIALRSAISVLQVQRARATADIQTLSKVKEEASTDPEAFLKDLAAGKVKSREFTLNLSSLDNDENDDEEEDDDGDKGMSAKAPERAWSSLPKPQNIVRCPPINWTQYAVVGESLDKLHAEQLSHPPQGAPATLGPNGAYEFKAGDGKKSQRYPGVAAPYDPLKDKVDRKPKTKS